jgi:hypothetical protein
MRTLRTAIAAAALSGITGTVMAQTPEAIAVGCGTDN